MLTIEEIHKEINMLSDADKKRLISELVQQHKDINPFEFIETTICNHFNIPLRIMRSKTRKQEIVLVRHLIMYFARKQTTLSLATIGMYIGGKDHATVLHACNKIDDLLARKPEFRLIYKIINQKLNPVSID